MANICFIVVNCIEFIMQINNMDNKCLKKIDEHIINFYVIYQITTCISFLISFGLFIIIPIFIYC